MASTVVALSLLSFLLTPPIRFPFSSRATTPIPASQVLGHHNASQLILVVPLFGFSHCWWSWFRFCLRGALILSSCMSRLISSITRVGFGRVPSNSALRLVFHMCNMVIMQDCQLRVRFIPSLFSLVLHSLSHLVLSRPKASVQLMPHTVAHMGSVQPHPITMCSLVSSSPHIAHSGRTFMPRRTRLDLTATAFVAKRHT